MGVAKWATGIEFRLTKRWEVLTKPTDPTPADVLQRLAINLGRVGWSGRWRCSFIPNRGLDLRLREDVPP